MGEIADKADRLGRQTDQSDTLDIAVRVGLVAYGVVHLMIAWLALQLAFGDKSGQASSTGALHELAQQPLGSVLIWAIAIGMFLLVVWRAIEAAVGSPEKDGKDQVKARLVSAGKAIIYASIGVSALRIATGSGGSKGGTDSTTAKLMNLPGGQLIVGLVALGILAYGGNMIRRAWTEKFREHLSSEGTSGDDGAAYIWFGKIGYVAKGLAIGIVGLLFGYAAITHEANKSGGLDQALQKVLQQPFGPYLLGVIALGIGCYGLFCFARARHLSR